ncbi:hypothetical protein IMZ48_23480 [Candidatus Bathyarchaeota archaeon]|nr:hypothetical protein [Candidatus Bathyarchaeota archaeon]
MRNAGFANVVHEKFKVPFGVWPKDPLLKEVGGYNHAQASMGLEGLTMRLYTGVLGWSEQEVIAFLARVRKDLNNPRIHAMFDL